MSITLKNKEENFPLPENNRLLPKYLGIVGPIFSQGQGKKLNFSTPY